MEKTSSKVIEPFVSKCRGPLMGLAILMVVAYHATACKVDCGHMFNMLFSYGLSGVDIFMLFSGIGLCYSYNKNTTRQFYYNRYKKILPFFFLLVFFYVLMAKIKNTPPNLSLFDVICMGSTLTFLGIGYGVDVDWYLNTMIYYYLLFPLFYFCVKRYRLLFVYLVCIISTIYVSFLSDNWMYQSAIGRIPIYIIGMYVYERVLIKNTISYKTIMLLLLPFALSFITITIYHENGSVYYIAPFMITFLFVAIYYLTIQRNNFINKCKHLVNSILSFVGKFTLEIYVANCMSMSLTYYFKDCFPNKLVLYISLNILLSLILASISSYFKLARK